MSFCWESYHPTKKYVWSSTSNWKAFFFSLQVLVKNNTVLKYIENFWQAWAILAFKANHLEKCKGPVQPPASASLPILPGKRTQSARATQHCRLSPQAMRESQATILTPSRNVADVHKVTQWNPLEPAQGSFSLVNREESQGIEEPGMEWVHTWTNDAMGHSSINSSQCPCTFTSQHVLCPFA